MHSRGAVNRWRDVRYSPDELMTVAAARCVSSEDVCFVGIGLPSAACNLARLTHAPRITLIYDQALSARGRRYCRFRLATASSAAQH
jgi:acyl CoA:acetate/3-ketoacid CoA transferase beta subunit